MAITQRASGTWAVATTQSPSVAIPAGYQAGDLGILVSVWRPFSVTATVNQSWTELIDETPGSTANGIGVGSSRVYVAYKELGASETDPTLTRSAAITPGGQVIIVLQKGAADGPWTVATLSNAVEQAMGSTAMSHALTTTAAITAGDLVFALTGVADDSATFTRATTAISGGPTWSGNVVEYPATHASSTTGNDMAADLIYRAASSSVASGQSITVTATLSAAERVASVLFRVGAVQGVTLPLLDAAAAVYAPTVSQPTPQAVTLPLLGGSGYADEVLADSPTFALPAGESSGNLTDIVGSKTATANGTPTYGNTGAVLGYTTVGINSADDYFEVADHADLDLGSGGFSIECWYGRSSDTGGWEILLSKGTNGYEVGVDNNDKMSLTKSGILQLAIGPAVVADGTLHHYVWTVAASPSASGDYKLYVDGSLATLTFETYSQAMADTANALWVGHASGDPNIRGTVGWVALYKSVLSSTRIAAHYAAAQASGGAAVYAPTLTQTSPPQTVTLPLLDAAAAVYTPTVQAGALTVTLPLLDAAAAVYAPTVIPGAATVTLPIVDSGPAVYAPTVTLPGVAYLSPSGNDTTGDGSIGSPWATIQKWIDSAPAAGSTLYLRGGTYSSPPLATSGHGSFVLTGTAGSPITIRNYPGETPVLTGGADPFLALAEAAYVIVDGLTLAARDCGDSGYIYTGAWTTGYEAHHITIRNCVIDFSLTGQATTEHGIYPSKASEYITVEDCIFKGPGAGNGGGYGFHAYTGASNGPRNLTVQRCIFDGWNQAGIVLWHSAVTGTFSHNTFVRNVVDFRAEVHAAITIADSAFDTASGSSAIADPTYSAQTTLSSNYFSQTFVSGTYYPVDGSSALNGAGDGSDAGAEQVDYVTLPLVDASPAVYAPTIAAAATAQTLTLGLLDAGAAVYAPTVLPQPVTVTLPLLDGGAAVYAPTLTPKSALTLPLIDAGSAVYAPTLSPKSTLTTPLLDAGAAVYAPTLAVGPLTLVLPLLDAGPAVYAPALTPKSSITLGLIDAGAAVYAPVLTVAPATITLGLIDGSAAVYAPTIIPGAVAIGLALLDAGAAVYAPTLGPLWTIALPLIDAGPAVYAPAITATGGFDLPPHVAGTVSITGTMGGTVVTGAKSGLVVATGAKTGTVA